MVIVQSVDKSAGYKTAEGKSRNRLTRHSGMADAELQLITGHARRETLAVYQHIALDGELEKKYHDAMRDVEL